MAIEHYNDEYFDWQKNVGAFGGIAELFKFKKFVQKEFRVLDFGSGGGYLLSNLDCNEKAGVEVNEAARNEANKLGVATYRSTLEIEDDWADLIVSNHALEHVENPLIELKQLYKKLKQNGKIVFVVPIEKKNKYKPNDINFHLYTWSEMNLGNLFVHAGFDVIEVKELKYKWHPKFAIIKKIAGQLVFDLVCYLYGNVSSRISQIRIVGDCKLNSV